MSAGVLQKPYFRLEQFLVFFLFIFLENFYIPFFSLLSRGTSLCCCVAYQYNGKSYSQYSVAAEVLRQIQLSV